MIHRPPPGAPKEVAELDRLVRRVVQEQAATAASCVLVAPRGREREATLHQGVVGTARPGPPPLRLVAPALFDVGALTQNIVTATLAAWLVGRGRLDLAKPLKLVAADVPHLRDGAWRDIPLETLLDHTSGLPAEGEVFAQLARAHARPAPSVQGAAEAMRRPTDAPLRGLSQAGVRRLGGPLDPAATDKLVQQLASTAPVAAPGTRVQPSALNALALGWALEAVLDQPLDEAFAALIAGPLGISDALHFVRCGPQGPWQAPPKALGASGVAAGGSCPMRRRPLLGEVRCPIAYLLGGVAGHAGLFASAPAIAAVLQAHLAVLEGRSQLLGAGVVQRFWTRSKRVADTPYALGWQVAARHNGLSPGRWHARTCGAATNEGAAAFADPAFGVVGVLLANVPAGAAPDAGARFEAVRRRVFDAMASHGQYAQPLQKATGRPR